ncbi:MarR-like DNA-binding transcriptional regulator SgrR of sgrS sRNA [Salirhabdus euzebyi]|uniref:MarR-like DNA-binding transcriptional regulator SgrR of sgrS sRNA n=1 Tax=Salirhabdus euzebyi TaxID=394506 RepID=A0A841Q573_9BACI|nr:SgrR family transcriptional regulator [Salirhabdus euzebyi]MBB6453551.1 MarR-like DNA-binding transcriptional regulator SgrR of sgrS sRNA [Salirhabdus euzebyi]
MLLEEHYFLLREQFYYIPNNEPVELKLDQLSEVLHCTRRNVNFLLRKMEEKDWLTWIPGRGRGHVSKLIFTIEKDKLLLACAQEKVKDGDIKSAHELLHTFHIKQENYSAFSSWLDEQFGFHRENKNEERSDVLRFPFYRPLPLLDPAYVNRRTEAHMIKQIFDTLVIYNEKTEKIEPHLCHHWKSDNDKQTWTFYVKKGIRFHDGNNLTSEDVKFTLERLRNKQTRSLHSWMVEGIETVRILHEYALEISLKEPNALFDLFLTTERMSIVPKNLANYPSFGRLPIGSGPFKVERNDASIFSIVANEDYFKERAYLDQIEVWIWPDYNGEALIPLKESDIKYMPISSIDFQEKLSFKRKENVEKGCYYIVFNLAKEGPQQIRNIREAIHLSLDRKRMIQELGGLRYKPASGFLLDKPNSTYAHAIDLDKAKKLVKESDYNQEILHLYTYEMKTNEENAKWVQNQAEKIGIKVKVHILPITELKKKEKMMEADIIISGEVFSNHTDLAFLDMYKIEDSFISNLLNDELTKHKDTLLAESMEADNIVDRMSKLKQLETLLKESFALLFVYHSKQAIYHHQSLHGVTLNSLGWINYKDVWIEKG